MFRLRALQLSPESVVSLGLCFSERSSRCASGPIMETASLDDSAAATTARREWHHTSASSAEPRAAEVRSGDTDYGRPFKITVRPTTSSEP